MFGLDQVFRLNHFGGKRLYPMNIELVI